MPPGSSEKLHDDEKAVDGETRRREEEHSTSQREVARNSCARPLHAPGGDFSLTRGSTWIGPRSTRTRRQPNANLDLAGPHSTCGVVLGRIHANTHAPKRGLINLF